MHIGVPKETWVGEKRVALVPATVKKLVKAGFEITVETAAGATAGFSDEDYTEAGASIEKTRSDS